MRLFWKFLMWLFKWKIQGNFPENIRKFIIVVAPHSSNWDFVVGVMVRGAVGFRARYLAKASLFRFPFGFIFRALGGIPVDRKTSHKMVDQIAWEVEKHKSFILAITPEGTRKKVLKWRTGFYFIAEKAGIPLVPAQLDWENRQVNFLEPFYPTGNIDKDLPQIQSLFEKIRGFKDI